MAGGSACMERTGTSRSCPSRVSATDNRAPPSSRGEAIAGASQSRAAKHDRVPLSTSAAEGGGGVIHFSPSHLVHQRYRHPGSGRAEGVSKRDRSTVHVDDALVEAEEAIRVYRHRCEG